MTPKARLLRFCVDVDVVDDGPDFVSLEKLSIWRRNRIRFHDIDEFSLVLVVFLRFEVGRDVKQRFVAKQLAPKKHKDEPGENH